MEMAVGTAWGMRGLFGCLARDGLVTARARRVYSASCIMS